ncbi:MULTISPECIES: exodeoxyribonuclease V subunit gamma [Edwardsiella]|uniref:RecBCD enzyme subunit RecC n=2 Tax=Edwardsiella anguillarum TaxID=1821960 RepID=A0A076LQE3_9GAMM|nr:MULTISPECIES: exodeoxyribonuclease V subunit gamma [Edwardsiella]AIJ08912.1 Exodeoxyribonuclease V gamma chain [Edwardsiella anguillarum ET080813]AKR76900.1 exodeoxyribonuclease V subunit gamma [Edwardsiella sp. LADL05-105]KAB0592328.1 exodeoxyribonuclease V subunit gamma [Edwardsiella anguillarum]UOU79817.1 exodeoxyribonuclease V subunit gamma [Edwardsiella anguillarum]WHP80953.1 exodeoxyribonuclease V subunit gamma [Edwardsiella anguillarum]
MFTVYHSNQLDVLTQLMAALMQGQPLETPFAREVILVQSPGMSQWLQMELARSFGIAANIDFPLPATFIWELFTQVLPDIPQRSAFSKDAMTWKLMWLLPQFLDRPAFAPLAHYLSDDTDRRKHFQLAARIADLYDQYLVYRPEWLQRWEQGGLIEGLDSAQQWQAPLWVALRDYTEQLGQPQWHRANLYQRFIQALKASDGAPPGLPRRVFICGISALPPVYLEALRALGEHIDVHLMFTNPCRYYWGDIQDYAFLARLQSRRRRDYLLAQCSLGDSQSALFRVPEQAAALFSEEGEQALSNPLLASWGKLGRDHMYLLAQHGPQEVSAFVDLAQDTLLQRIQRDMLELEDHACIAAAAPALQDSRQKRRLASDDRSISVHVCHSPQREVEVLHDSLLDMFAADATLSARDVIVMVADIDSYAPFIQAVFGNAPAARYLPFAISDRSARQLHPVVQALLALLDLPHSRFNAEQVLALLEVPALAARFDIDDDGIRLLRHWVEESGIRWGLDDDAVRDLALPATGQHTWQFGLTRMLLGYAMDSRSGEWQGVLPYDESSGTIAELAGQLAQFLAALRDWRQRLGQMQTLAQWQPLCRALLDDFFVTDADSEAVCALIEQQWLKLIEEGLASAYPETLPITVLRDELTARLDNQRISQRFLAGPINFCTLMPMRSIPFKVVCLLGMNDGVYPRTLAPLGFDLMAGKAQRGDRSRRDDDRYLFLEALLSAQQRLYISYIGRSVQDNSARYPSVLVSELLEYIAQSHCLAQDVALDVDSSAERVMAHLCHTHPRVPFDAENFDPQGEFQSYASEWLPAACGQGIEHPPFAARLAPLPLEHLTLDMLIRFYRHPVRAFFQQRLGVSFIREESELPQEEPFTLDALSRYQINQLLLNRLIGGDEIETLYRQIRAAGALPFGAFGALWWQAQCDEMTQLAQRVGDLFLPGESLEIDRTLDGCRLTGWLPQAQASGLVRWRPAELGATDGIVLWIEHLLFCLAQGGGDSWMFGRKNTTWHFAGLDAAQAERELVRLIEGYREGMQAPLLLTRSGWQWLKCCYDKETGQLQTTDDARLAKAHGSLLQAWNGDAFSPGEGQDAYLQRVVRTLDNAAQRELEAQAQRFYLPLLHHNLA